MAEPELIFVLLSVAGVLFVAFFVCFLVGTVWFFVGWRKQCKPLQYFAVLPLAISAFIIAPALVLVLSLAVLWLVFPVIWSICQG